MGRRNLEVGSGSSEVGSRKKEVGVWKLECGSRKKDVGIRNAASGPEGCVKSELVPLY